MGGDRSVSEVTEAPTSIESAAILREVHALTGKGRYVFPCARAGDRPMSNNAILAALRRMGFGKDEMTGHGPNDPRRASGVQARLN